VLKRFSSFSLDTDNQCIWRGETRVQLAPKAYAILAYLIENPGRIVTKEELLETVWPDTFVQESVLKTCVLEIRKALGESAKDTKHIDTVHRRGYRFVPEAVEAPPLDVIAPAPDTNLVGRKSEMEALKRRWAWASAGERQAVFITGEPGIGKSMLIAHFLEEIGRTNASRILRGQCIEHFGSSEAYYPVFDALTGGVRDGTAPGIVEVLRKHAPTWLVQMPGITPAGDLPLLKQQTVGATQERMLREMSEAIEVLAEAEPLIVVIEDLHWCDVSTLDLIAMMANRTGKARLLMLISYRPVDAVLSNHPVRLVKQSLVARGRSIELELPLFTPSETAEFVGVRFSGQRLPAQFAGFAHASTDGNPLFVAHILEYALARSVIRNQNGEWSKIIEALVERLSPREQGALEAASLAGMAFTAQLVAGDEPDELHKCEECLEGLARRGLFIHSSGLERSRPSVVEYRFTHAFYREIFCRRLPAGRRMRLHQAIGERLERLYAASLSEVAGELASHFQASHDIARAVLYLRLLAQKCAARHALPDALGALTQALELTGSLQEPGRTTAQFELAEQLGLVHRLMGQLDSAAREFDLMFNSALQMRSAEGQLRAQLWLASVASFLDRDRCLGAADTVLTLCESRVDPELRSNALGQVAYWNLLFRGWNERDVATSSDALDAARRSGDRSALALHATRHSYFLALSSRYDEAYQMAEEGIRIAVEIESLLDYSIGYYFAAWSLLHLGEWGRMKALLNSAIKMADRNGHRLWALLCELLEVFLEIQTFSFEPARNQCRQCLIRARELNHPLSIQISLVLLGFAELGAGEPEAARQAFGELRSWQARERILMDWIWKLPLQLGLTELCLAEGNLEAAHREAEGFLALASATDECTWKALACYAGARVAIAGQDAARAEREITKGFAAIGDRAAPLATWRLHAIAAEVFGDHSHMARAQHVMTRLAVSFPAGDPLRESLLASPLMRNYAQGSHAGGD
jgi:DNA-binding winged helix-turn-helix (wHTH) protein